VAGHNVWKKIKRKKAVTDARRGAHFTKLIKEITVAARQGGGDPAGNARLRTAIDAARVANMPSDNIDRAIKKGTGQLEGVHYEEVTYEGYGPGGAAIFIEVTTDNAKRTVADIRHLLTRFDGKLGTNGSVAHLFEKRGEFYIPAAKYAEDATIEAALDAGALDVVKEGEHYIVTTAPHDFHAVQESLKKHGIQWDSAEISMVPRSTVRVEGRDAEKLVKLMGELEEHDDVARVSSNFDVDVEALAEV
jgi:YebC/PmpR family DNA-binding regulatory protein